MEKQQQGTTRYGRSQSVSFISIRKWEYENKFYTLEMGLYDDDDIFLMADFKTFLRECNQRNSEMKNLRGKSKDVICG